VSQCLHVKPITASKNYCVLAEHCGMKMVNICLSLIKLELVAKRGLKFQTKANFDRLWLHLWVHA